MDGKRNNGVSGRNALVLNLAMDLLYTYLDPRIELS